MDLHRQVFLISAPHQLVEQIVAQLAAGSRIDSPRVLLYAIPKHLAAADAVKGQFRLVMRGIAHHQVTPIGHANLEGRHLARLLAQIDGSVERRHKIAHSVDRDVGQRLKLRDGLGVDHVEQGIHPHGKAVGRQKPLGIPTVLESRLRDDPHVAILDRPSVPCLPVHKIVKHIPSRLALQTLLQRLCDGTEVLGGIVQAKKRLAAHRHGLPIACHTNRGPEPCQILLIDGTLRTRPGRRH